MIGQLGHLFMQRFLKTTVVAITRTAESMENIGASSAE